MELHGRERGQLGSGLQEPLVSFSLWLPHQPTGAVLLLGGSFFLLSLPKKKKSQQELSDFFSRAT